MTDSTELPRIIPTKPVHISAKGLHEFTPEGLKGRDPECRFWLHIPTFAQRDGIAQLMFSSGVMPVTVEHGRAVLISELFNIFALPDPETGEVPEGMQEGDPDEIASFLEGYWQRADVYEEVLGQWALQEKERLIDQLHGAEERDGYAMPAPPYTTRETARAKRLSMEMLEWSESYRKLQALYASYNEREDLMLFRLFCAGWVGLEAKPGHLKTGPLTEDCVESLREELARIDPINPNQFYLELVREIRDLMGIDKETEKNFASPPGLDSSPSGSDARSAESANGGGSWTGSSIEPIPPSESPPISATSSISPSRRGTRTRKAGRTAPA